MHASGFIHMRFFLERTEYLIGVTTNLQFASREAAQDIGQLWASQDHRADLNFQAKLKIMKSLSAHMRFEYTRRCRRHAFYEGHGLGEPGGSRGCRKSRCSHACGLVSKPSSYSND